MKVKDILISDLGTFRGRLRLYLVIEIIMYAILGVLFGFLCVINIGEAGILFLVGILIIYGNIAFFLCSIVQQIFEIYIGTATAFNFSLIIGPFTMFLILIGIGELIYKLRGR